MSIKILTKNSIDNTNIDGARQNHFSAGMRSGIVKGAFNEGRFFTSASNVIALDTCELRISGHQVIIDSLEAITLSDRPTTPTKYSMIAEIQVSDTSVPSFRLFIQPANVVLRQENLFKTNNGSGIYQLRIGNFTLGTTGLISDVVRTADIITGGGEGGIADIKFNATATQLSSSSQPEVNADYNEETKKWDLNFGIPAGSGTNVTIGGVIQGEWSADFAESERQKSETDGAITHNLDSPVVFAESERQKSKNLVGGTYDTRTLTENGITFTVNDDNSITLKGTATKSATFELDNVILPAGTYVGSVRKKSDGSLFVGSGIQLHYDDVWTNVYDAGGNINPRTLAESKLCDFELYVSAGITVDDTVYVQVEAGDVVTDYQPYNGAIVHEKEIAGLKGQVLWKNSTPTVEFVAQIVTLSTDGYDYLEIVYRYSTDYDWQQSTFVEKGAKSLLQVVNTPNILLARITGFVGGNSLKFEKAFLGQNGSEGVYNNYVIPVKIIGYKRS